MVTGMNEGALKGTKLFVYGLSANRVAVMYARDLFDLAGLLDIWYPSPCCQLFHAGQG